jgi:hypothetical protein
MILVGYEKGNYQTQYKGDVATLPGVASKL